MNFSPIDFTSDSFACAPTYGAQPQSTTDLLFNSTDLTPPTEYINDGFLHYDPQAPFGLQGPAHDPVKDSLIYNNEQHQQHQFFDNSLSAVLAPPPYVYPTPAQTPLDSFAYDLTSPLPDQSPFLGDYDDPLLSDLLHFDTSKNTFANAASPEVSLEELFGDYPLFDNTASLGNQGALFPDLENFGAFDVGPSPAPAPSAQSFDTVDPLAETNITLSIGQLTALLAAAAENSKTTAVTQSPALDLSPLDAFPSLDTFEAFTPVSPVHDDFDHHPVAEAVPNPELTKPSKPTTARRTTNPAQPAIHTCPHPGCNRQFSRRFNLQSHVEIHDPNRARAYDCPTCPRKFFKHHDLARHLVTHAQEKRFVCNDCGKRYSRVDALKRHIVSKGCNVDM